MGSVVPEGHLEVLEWLYVVHNSSKQTERWECPKCGNWVEGAGIVSVICSATHKPEAMEVMGGSPTAPEGAELCEPCTYLGLKNPSVARTGWDFTSVCEWHYQEGNPWSFRPPASESEPP